MTDIVNDHIRDTTKNVTEYCKSEQCWISLKEKRFGLPKAIEEEYYQDGAGSDYDFGITTEKEAISFCTDKKSEAWFKLSKWLKNHDFLTPKARSQCFNMGRKLFKEEEPSAALSIPCKNTWENAELRGRNPDIEMESEERDADDISKSWGGGILHWLTKG